MSFNVANTGSRNSSEVGILAISAFLAELRPEANGEAHDWKIWPPSTSDDRARISYRLAVPMRLSASASRAVAEPGRSAFGWLSCGAQPCK